MRQLDVHSLASGRSARQINALCKYMLCVLVRSIDITVVDRNVHIDLILLVPGALDDSQVRRDRRRSFRTPTTDAIVSDSPPFWLSWEDKETHLISC